MTAAAGSAASSAVGKQLTVTGVDWSRSDKTLVFALQRGCHFCAESAPFYQRLKKEQAKLSRTRYIAVLPQSVDEATDYLNGLSVSVDEVKQSRLDTIEVDGTPTLLLVDNKGIIKNVWVGKLSTERENDVISKLQTEKAGS